MNLHRIFFNLFRTLVPPAILSTLCLYLYPILSDCGFPFPPEKATTDPLCLINSSSSSSAFDASDFYLYKPDPVAPFRLLTLGDPQLEGDSALPTYHTGLFPSLDFLADEWTPGTIPQVTGRIAETLSALLLHDVPRLLLTARKQLDLLGNDFYLAHIYRQVTWWTKPSHVVVVGDLVGSQWVDEKEWENRAHRFWGRVFRGAERVPDSLTARASPKPGEDATNSNIETLGADPAWATRLITLPGNHDIGYAGDIQPYRIQRFERSFGKVNWDVRFQLNVSNEDTNETKVDSIFSPVQPQDPPELRLVIFNDMNLDGPAFDNGLQHETLDFLNDVIFSSRPVEDRTAATVLLTHIPLHKREGLCTDGPSITYRNENEGGGILSQNHLSQFSSRQVLENIYGMNADTSVDGGGRGRPGIILNGHDHEGCDVYHYIDRSKPLASSDDNDENNTPWDTIPGAFPSSQRIITNASIPGIREITVRSMMGDYSGTAGMLSAWFDTEQGEWVFKYAECRFAPPIVWWGVHIFDLVVLSFGLLSIWALFRQRRLDRQAAEREARRARKQASLNGDAAKRRRTMSRSRTASSTSTPRLRKVAHD